MLFRYAAGMTFVAGCLGASAPVCAETSEAAAGKGAEAKSAGEGAGEQEAVAALKAEIAALRARLNALEARLDTVGGAAGTTPAGAPSAVASAPSSALSSSGGLAAAGALSSPPSSPPSSAPSTAPQPAPSAAAPALAVAWKPGPLLRQGDWSFKPKGRLQVDAVSVNAPGGIADKGTGFASEVRRLRLGGEGTMPGGFGYKIEAELADNQINLVDAYLSWHRRELDLKIGNQNAFQSLDELTGDSVLSLMERPAFTSAFNFQRRLGLSAEWRKGAFIAQGGAFTDSPANLSDTATQRGDADKSFGFDGRLVFAPRLGATQLHFAASGHWRDLNGLETSGMRYRARPFVHASNSRFLDTGVIRASQESHYGVEFAAVRGPVHVASEAHWLTADRIDGPNPTFFGGYAEVGYYLTKGDSRAYRNGQFDRSTPAHPVDQGGLGSVQLTVRYDYLDLNDGAVRGGRQNGYVAGLVWSPVTYVRLSLDYAHLDYRDAVLLAGGRSAYGVNVVGMRAEVDY